MQGQRIAAYGLVVDGSRVLLTRASDITEVAGMWFLPGGGVEHGEDPADGVVRELREETGFEGEVVELLTVLSDVRQRRSAERLHSVRVIYALRIVAGELTPETSGSSDAARWWDLDAALELRLAPFARTVLERYSMSIRTI